jgi:2-dehydropantoate 2-reductase
MNIGIWGTGAMGSFAAWRLSSALNASDSAEQHKLTVYGHHQPRLRQINQHGINLISLDKRRTSFNVLATSDIPQLPELDIALVFNKTYQLDRVAGEVHRSVKQHGLVICFQNGMGSDRLVREANPDKKIAAGILFEGVTLDQTGDILHKGSGSTWLSLSPQTEAMYTSLLSLLRLGGFDLRVQSDISSIQWAKLAANAAINPLTALTGAKNKQVAEHPLLRNIASAVAAEITRVAELEQIRRDSEYLEHILYVAMRTGENTSSMLTDIRQGRETEVQHINGAIVKLGRKHKVQTPVNQMLTELVEDYRNSPISLEILENHWQRLISNHTTQQ